MSSFRNQQKIRHPNNWSNKFRDQCADLAKAVENNYGEEYRETVIYLNSLARNQAYTQSQLPPLRWHQRRPGAPQCGDPVNRLHQSVLDALMPGVALRATFGGSRHV